MDELDGFFAIIPPMVQVGAHSLNVHVAEHADGVTVELRHPNVGTKTYRVMTTGVVPDRAAVLGWIDLVAPAVGMRLDAETRATMKALGYRT